jgi:NADH:ubiquinone oxidoreductase subunit 6 (subunit J)
MDFFQLLFFLLVSIIFISAIITISAKNPINSLLFLILVFVNVVILLLFLKTDFLAMLFLMVYVGAVAVLFLFVLMMLNIRYPESGKELIHYFPMGVIFGVLFLYLIFSIFSNNSYLAPFAFNSVNDIPYTNWINHVDNITNIEVIGQLMYTYYFTFFIMCGIGLLVAMLGAIILTIEPKDLSVKRQQIYQQTSRSSSNAIFTIKN